MERPMSGLVVQLWRRWRDFSEDERWKVRSGVLWNSGKMAMALLRREGKRFAPLLSSPSINDAINGTARSSIISEEITPQGACDGVFDRVWQWCRDGASISESESESDFQRR